MKDNFKKIVPFVHLDEGEYSNDPGDDGGPTRLGITYIDYAKWLKVDPGEVTPDMVRDMPEEVAGEIYKAWYWDRVRADELPSGIDYFVFDCALHSGVGKAIYWLQSCLGVAADGELGPRTMAAVKKADPAALLGKLEELRRRYLRGHPDWPIFARGWTNRVNKVVKRAKKML